MEDARNRTARRQATASLLAMVN